MLSDASIQTLLRTNEVKARSSQLRMLRLYHADAGLSVDVGFANKTWNITSSLVLDQPP